MSGIQGRGGLRHRQVHGDMVSESRKAARGRLPQPAVVDHLPPLLPPSSPGNAFLHPASSNCPPSAVSSTRLFCHVCVEYLDFAHAWDFSSPHWEAECVRGEVVYSASKNYQTPPPLLRINRVFWGGSLSPYFFVEVVEVWWRRMAASRYLDIFGDWTCPDSCSCRLPHLPSSPPSLNCSPLMQT